MMVIENLFELKQEVYLRTDPDQVKRIVTAIVINPGDLIYELSCGTSSSRHYDFEISAEKDMAYKTSN